MENEKRTVTGQQLFIAYPAAPDDEINLLDIWKVLWGNKKIIIGSVIACVLLTTVVVMILPKIYRVSMVLRPPMVDKVIELSTPSIYKADPAEVYSEFLKNLQSKGLQYKYFQTNKLVKQLDRRGTGESIDEYEAFLECFNRQIRIISEGKGKTPDFTTVTLDGSSREALPLWLDKYITFIDNYTVVSLVNEVDARLKVRSKEVKDRIARLRLIASWEHDDRIAHLKEALIIAKQLNIKKPTGSAFISNDQGQNVKAKPTGVILDSQDVPLYFRGYEALQSELKQLQQRKNDDSFILGLRELEGELTALEKIDVDSKLIHSVWIDQEVRVDKKPVSPKQKLIIMLGAVLGLILGVLGAFVRKLFQQ